MRRDVRRSINRLLTLVTALAVLLTMATQEASAFTSLQAQNTPWPSGPQQSMGTAAGRSHTVSAADTERISGATSARHKPGKGELGDPAGTAGLGPSRSSNDPRAAVSGKKSSPPVELPAGGHTASSVRGAVASRELLSARTATTSVFQNSDGTRTMRVYSRPVHYKMPNGTWGNINTSLVQGPDGRWQESANSENVSFAGNSASLALVTSVVDAGHQVSYGLQGALPVQAVVKGSTITYPDAAQSADVQYNALASSIKETLILHSSAAPTTWTFPLQLTGLTPSLDKTGDVVFTDATGKVDLTIPHGSMEDSSKDLRSGEGAQSNGVTYSLVTVDGAPALRMHLDAAWLDAPGRVFPVRVDPSTAPSQNAGTSTFVETNMTENTALRLDVWVRCGVQVRPGSGRA
jgi:hypothetical protein